MQDDTPGSVSVEIPDHWWYRARERLFTSFFSPFVDAGPVIDVGSADGPSVQWLDRSARRIAIDLDVCSLRSPGLAADARALPFRTSSVNIVCAFDVIEHFEDRVSVLSEFKRVLRPGGRLLVSVPAYQALWSGFDEASGHHCRYTRSRLREELEDCGYAVERSSYAFAATLPFLAAQRVWFRLAHRPPDATVPSGRGGLGGTVMRTLLRADECVLRHRNLPFGSSVVAVARLT